MSRERRIWSPQEKALQEHALVMNFANAHHPGGGFIAGASAQEESLCRCSSLFASINSEKAREMYKFNNENPNPFDSDYMLISQYVEVFRHAGGKLRDDNFTTAVLTIPAPNLCGIPRSCRQILDCQHLFVQKLFRQNGIAIIHGGQVI